jgi:hypothetical protein
LAIAAGEDDDLRSISMAVPVTGPIQFVPPGGVYLTVDSITDPGGAPAEVIDVDLGFTVSGTVVLPNWLAGSGTVCIYVDEQGGPIDEALSPCATITLVPTNTEPNPKVYPWTISFPGTVLPDPSPGSQIYRLLAKFMYENQATDIAGFVVIGDYLIN